MVSMVIDRPLGEYGVRLLFVQQRLIVCIVFIVDNGAPIRLAGIKALASENLAGFFGFRKPRCSWGRRPVSFVEIKQADIVASFDQSSNRAPTSILRIARVAATDDHFELAINSRTHTRLIRSAGLPCRHSSRYRRGHRTRFH